MGRKIQYSREYTAFKILQHWEPTTTILPPKELANPSGKLFSLFAYLHEKAQQEYEHFPLRKNGEKPFIHPINIVWQLQKAGVEDELTWCIGLMHDFVEEKVDVYKQEQNLRLMTVENIKQLDHYEEKLFQELRDNLEVFCEKTGIPCSNVIKLMTALRLLTHHKRDFYYRYISNIFNCKDQKLKEQLIQVKLADRMHNILCIQCFSEEERLFQCYKNLFILNNTKKFLLDRYGKGVFKNKKVYSTEKLFNKCGKATYDAFLAICHLARKKGIGSVASMLQLAFKKFELQEKGLWVVTKVNERENHPVRLFQGIVRKYDARLVHEWDKFEKLKKDEFLYCKHFFLDYQFSDEQIQALLDYKDGFALREIVAYLLYQDDFVISGFLSSRLFHKNK